STFDASSVRFCPECRRDIRISFGGEKNWTIHLRSREHSKSAAIKKHVSITTFFKTQNSLKSVPTSTATSSASATSLGAPVLLLTCANISASDPQEWISVTAESCISSPTMTGTRLPALLDPGLALLLRIRDRVPLLLDSVDVGTPDDELAQFSVNPTWKRFSVAIGTHDIPRLRKLITSELKRGGSVFAILTKVDRAVQKNYSPRGYERTDFECAYLIWKLGGASAAEIAFRTMGLPSISATRRFIHVRPLRASPSDPTTYKIEYNLRVSFSGLPSLQARQEASAALSNVYVGVVMAMDEIKLQERLRWDERTNNILGICWEHGHKCSLQFWSLADADAILDAIQRQEVHFASLATVIGFFMLAESPQEYCFTPFIISGTCSKGTVEMQQAITLVSELQPQSTIFPILSPLRLFNRKCGLDDLTCDFDWKHVLKRFHNTLLCQMGITVDGTHISMSILKKYLIDCGLPITTVEILLAPNDHQDVVLMLRLLNSISQVPPAKADDPPSVQSSRRIICLLGRLYHHLLNAYLDVSLSLSEQLTHLSAAAHIILAVYSRDKGNFIPVQLCYNTQSMVKNVYFTVAKAQWDRPLSKCHIILLGTDGEEKVFGQCRTMRGGDSGNDQLQLTNRLNGAESCVKILEEHPDWGGQSRHLKVQTLQSQGSEIARTMDHLNPCSWEGDVLVWNMTLLRCWKEGRHQAEKDLNSEPTDRSNAFEPWVSINPAQSSAIQSLGTQNLLRGKRIHKATVLRIYSDPMTARISKDCLRTVRGYTQYNESLENKLAAATACLEGNTSHDEFEKVLHVEDPAVTLLTFNIDDWEWNGKFEQVSAFRSRFNGHWIDVFNPSVQSATTTGPVDNFQTYSFRTAELHTTAAVLYERLKNSLLSLPQVVQSATFPYRTSNGDACFICERGETTHTPDRLHTLDQARCIRCLRIILSELSGPGLIRHCSAHLLHDPACRNIEACGFCLNSTGTYEDSDVFNDKNMDNDKYSASMDEIDYGSRQLEVNKASDNPNTPILSIADTNPISTSEMVSGDTATMSDGDEVLLTPPTVVEMEEITMAAGTIGSRLCGLRMSCKRRFPGTGEALEGAEIASCGECELLIDDSMNWVECSGPACSLKYHLHCQGLLEKPLSEWFCDDDCQKNAGFHVSCRRRT
ncbi:hypothetical protein IW262DRAFT_1258284, partial [Armillaria fumosa]